MAAMAGTWLGTLFTAIGLMALFLQLRYVWADFRQSRAALLAMATGDWKALIPQKDMPQQGLVEKVAPGFLGWLQHAYMEKGNVCLTQCNRMSAGTSGWSNLFAHCGIQADDLIQFGGSHARVLPAVTGPPGPGYPQLADLNFDNGKVLYGFSRNEFMALLIICGFSSADCSLSGCTRSTRLLGTIQLVDKEPLSQIAQFDAHVGCRHIPKDKERYINTVPVQTCINYAIGILETSERGDRRIIIPAKTISTTADHPELTAWMTRPGAAQLNEIRYTLEELVSISGADVLKYSVEKSKDEEYESSVMDKISPGNDFERAKTRQTLLIAHALAALKPWGLLPVLPNHFVQAFKPLIQPFIGSHSETVGVLQEHMRMLKIRPLDGWNSIEQQADALGQIGDVKDEFFSGSSSPCRNYFRAMNMVFSANRIRVDDVRTTLAAVAARRVLGEISVADDFVPNLITHLSKGQFSGEVPPWTVEIYATYVWGWLNDAMEMDFDYRGKFKRRVFLS